MHPAIDAIEADEAADAALLEGIADWCLRYTPLVACDVPDGLLLDISGCAHLYGGEDALVADLSGRLEAAGFAYRVAIAGSIGAAWAAAHFGEPGNYPCGDERKLLAPLPLAALRLDGGTVAALARVGLKRIGDIVELPRAPLTARFGAALLRQLDRALGQEHEPLTPRLPVAPYVAEQRFAEPIAREEDVLGSVARLAGRLQVALERRGDGARRIELTLFRTDGALRRIAVGCSRPLRDPDDIRALFTERLAALADALDPGFGFDMARLSVLVAEPCPPEQIGIGGAEDQAELDRLTDRLSARLGVRRVRQMIAQDSHIPEIAAISRAGADDGHRRRLGGLPPPPRRGGVGAAAAAALGAAGTDRSRGRSAGRPAFTVQMAARAARGDRRRRPRAYRGRLVERARRARPRLFPRRGQKWPAFLAVPRRALPRSGAGRGHAELVPARHVCVR